MKIIFQSLRCFGGLITDLRFNYAALHNNNRFDHFYRILFYIDEFCSEPVKSLLGIDILKEPFSNIERLLIINSSHLNERFLNELFPKLCHLCSLKCPDNTDLVIFELFPKLVPLNLELESVLNKASYEGNFTTQLRINPHLHCFQLMSYDYSCLDSLSQYLQHVEFLDITIEGNPKHDTLLHFKNVKRLTICHGQRRFHNLRKIPFLIDHITELELKYIGTFRSSFLTFLEENRMIEKLTLDLCAVSALIGACLRLKKGFPYIKEIVLLREYDSHSCFEALVLCLQRTKCLGVVSFFVSSEFTDDQIEDKLPTNIWRMCRTRYDDSKDLIRLERIELSF